MGWSPLYISSPNSYFEPVTSRDITEINIHTSCKYSMTNDNSRNTFWKTRSLKIELLQKWFGSIGSDLKSRRKEPALWNIVQRYRSFIMISLNYFFIEIKMRKLNVIWFTCCKINLKYKMCKSNDNQPSHFALIEEITSRCHWK